MKTITLNNGVEMPLIGYGTFRSTGEVCEQSVLAAIRAGYRLIDTAEAYGNEEAIGNAIAKCGVPREELFIVTKVFFHSHENARAAVENSMKKLQVSYLDMVLIHWPFGNYYAAWRDLEALYAEGKIRAIGISNFDPDRMIDLIKFNKVVPAVNQIETHLFCQRVEDRKWLDKYGVCHMAYSPLGQGKQAEIMAHPVMQEIAARHGKTPVQVALRYLTQRGVVIIPKSTNEERIRQNFDILDFELTADEMEQLLAMDTATPQTGDPENPCKVEEAMTW